MPRLHEAAAAGNIENVRKFLMEGDAVNELSSEQCTPLSLALIHNNERPANAELIALLLVKGAEVDTQALMNLCSKGVLEELEVLYLFLKLDPNAHCNENPLLDICIDNGKYSLATELVRYGAKVCRLDSEGRSYLHKSRDYRLTMALLEKKVPMEFKDSKGNTAIMYVDQKSMELLARRGASVSGLSLEDERVKSSTYLTEKLNAENNAQMLHSSSSGFFAPKENTGENERSETLSYSQF